jgi:hypothetical protein
MKLRRLRIDVRRKSRFVTQETDGVAGQQDAVDRRQDTARRTASQMNLPMELMGFQLVVYDFDFPSLVVEHNQLLSRINGRIQQGGDQSVTLTAAAQPGRRLPSSRAGITRDMP